VTQANELVSGFRSLKARALFYYVAVNGRPEARVKLAGLFWGDLPDANANANLRKTLTNLRHQVGAYLTITRTSVGLNEANPLWLDVAEFEEMLAGDDANDWQTAVSLYHGDFLEGFYIEGATEFETWVLAERYRLREKLLLTLHKLAKYLASQRQYAQAIGYAQQLIILEPLREDIHQLLMTLFAQSGQRARALAQYEACVSILAQELNTEPGSETRDLFHRIQTGEMEPFLLTSTLPPHNLPASITSFVGREVELEEIKSWLADINSRLLTIVGPGGVGKTRLALQAAWAAQDNFAHGIWFIPLTSLTEVGHVITAIVTTLDISFLGQASPETQVTKFLRHRESLLLLDNAEHLISQPLADLLTHILTEAAGVKIMVTSRQRLMMQAERVLNLSGLAYPYVERGVAISAYPARQLFLERCYNHGVTLESTSQAESAIQHLCALVEGLPLALELAAASTTTRSLPAINAEVEQGITFLTTHLRDMPPRHRSLRAVFDTSWQRLDHAEQQLMHQLAYFDGGFTEHAAIEITGATTAQLQTLARHSLLRLQADGRYDMHELIRQYSASKLTQYPDEAEEVAHYHGHYFAQFLAAREEGIQGADYLQAKAEIQADIENIHKGWAWLVSTQNLDDIARAAEALHYYYLNAQGMFADAAHRFQVAADEILQANQHEKAEQLAGRLWLQAAVNRRMLGQLAAAERLAQQSLTVFYRHEMPLGIARASSTLSVIMLQQNDKETAQQLAETAVAQARTLDNPITLCLCLNNLSYVLSYNEQIETAIEIAEESAALAQTIAYPHGMLSAMNMLGVYYQHIGEVEKAELMFAELVDRCRQAATKSRLAQAVNNLGALYQKQGELDKARPLLQEAVSLYQEVGQEHYAASVQVKLGEMALANGQTAQAWHYCQQALQVAQEVEISALTLNALALQAGLQSHQKEYEKAVSLLALVAHHPATEAETKEHVRHSLQKLQGKLSSQAFITALEWGKTWTLIEAVRRF
jgi:predicted ATPase/DNA-binding SARP family transcriptional activator